MATENSSASRRPRDAKPYDVAPAHAAQTVRAAAMPTASAPDANAPVANAPNQIVPLRGEEFDYDLSAPEIEPSTQSAETVVKPGLWKNIALWFLLALAVAYGIYTFGAIIGEKSRKPLAVGPFSAPSVKAATVKVHVAGAVNRPGVYDLPFNARVQDAIRKAGGPAPGANLNALNLADWAQDGAKIEVPVRAKPAPAATPTIIIKEVPVAAAPFSAAPASSSNSSGEPATSASGVPLAVTESGATSTNAPLEYLKAHPVDLNTATQAELEVLPGVGPKMAERILAYRTENGSFKSVDELDEVKGIGEKRMETLKSLVKVR